MQSDRSIEIKVIAGALIIGGLVFIWMLTFRDAIPFEYRNTSPGFGWSWDFDYETAMKEAGRSGAEPWPWPAKATGNRLVLPINQPLNFRGLEITYRGTPENGSFRLDVVIPGLDANFPYQRDLKIQKAEGGFTLAEHRFTLEKITSYYVRLRSTPQ
jgi:hypothetical protein